MPQKSTMGGSIWFNLINTRGSGVPTNSTTLTNPGLEDLPGWHFSVAYLVNREHSDVRRTLPGSKQPK